MSLEKIAATIEAKGTDGIKKADLKREFQELADLDSLLQELVRTQAVFVEKKGNSYYCWHKNYYLQKLLSSDQKFSLLYALMSSMRDSQNAKFDWLYESLNNVTKQVREVTEEIKLLASSNPRNIETNELSAQEQIKSTNINYDNFKEQLDQALASTSNSIGWVELCNLRKSLCLKMKISQEQFYHTFEQVVSNNYDKYELSTGGEEGIQLRGMMHGFVRCI